MTSMTIRERYAGMPAWAVPGAKCIWTAWADKEATCRCPLLQPRAKLTVKRAFFRDALMGPYHVVEVPSLEFEELHTEHPYMALCFTPIVEKSEEEDVSHFAHLTTKAPETVI